MIRKATIFSACLMLAILITCSFFLFLPSSSDYENYQKILEKRKRTLSAENFPSEKNIEQKREGVQKDLWVVNEEERLHFRLLSEHSDLSLIRKNKEMEVTENLKDIQCWIQEKLSPKENYQLLRYFSSEKGIYCYPSHSFFAPQLFLSFFQLPGVDLPEDLGTFSPYLEGEASQVFFQFTNKIPAFAASRLRALYKLDKELIP